MTDRQERNDRFILEEYHANGIEPRILPCGRPVSLELTRQIAKRATGIPVEQQREDVA